jgi:hypothetical protein
MASHSDEDFFSHTSGGFVLYSAKEGDTVSGCRFALARFGEDPSLVLQQFWDEQPGGNFVVAIVWGHGQPPRRSLCSKHSILSALETIMPEPGSAVEQRWKELCRDLGAAWPRHLQEVA